MCYEVARELLTISNNVRMVGWARYTGCREKKCQPFLLFTLFE